MLTSRALLALILTLCLSAPAQPLLAQQPVPAAAPVQSPATAAQSDSAAPANPQALPPAPLPPVIVESLKVIVLEGDGSINSVERHTARVPVVEIRDENDKPIESAEVIFRLPVSGPGGTFPDQKSTKTTRTNVQGQAAATGFTPNDLTGRFDIQVTASIGNRIGKGTVSQINATKVKIEPEKKPASKVLGLGWKKIAIIGGIAIGAIVIALVVTRNGSSSSGGGSTVTITPGPITIGGR